MYFKVYLSIGFFFIFNCAYTQNQIEADSLIKIYEKGGLTKLNRLDVLRRIALQATSPEDKIKYANELIELSKIDLNYFSLHSGYMQLGNALRLQGNLEEAIAAYFESANFAVKNNYEPGIGGAYLSIGDAYMANSDNENSIKYRTQAIAILRNTPDSITLATALLNTGYNYYSIQKYDSALLFYEESKIIFETKDYLIGKAYNLGNAGLVYVKQGKTRLAEQQLMKAVEILIELGDSYSITEFQIEMASIYQQKEDYQTAEKYLLEALAYAIQDGLQERIRDASMQLSELYQEVAEYKKAHFYLKQHIAYRDSISNEDVIRKMADLRTTYEVSQKQAEVDFLNKQSDSRQVILLGVMLVLGLACILAYVLYKLYRLRGRAIVIAAQRRELVTTQRDTLQELNNTKDKFFSIISHDIRGPVNNFHGIAYLIKEHTQNGEIDELGEVGEMLEKSSVELSSLLDNLLEWAMSQQGQFPYKLMRFDLSKPCNANLSMMSSIARTKEVKLTEKVEEEVVIEADLNSVSTIIRNLLNNAIKFTESGGSITLSIGAEGKMATIEIEDTGIGIAETKMKSLFGFKGERTQWGTDGEKGVGLGLNLVHEFVEMNKGRITVESEEGVGTSFVVYLPLALDS